MDLRYIYSTFNDMEVGTFFECSYNFKSRCVKITNRKYFDFDSKCCHKMDKEIAEQVNHRIIPKVIFDINNSIHDRYLRGR